MVDKEAHLQLAFCQFSRPVLHRSYQSSDVVLVYDAMARLRSDATAVCKQSTLSAMSH